MIVTVILHPNSIPCKWDVEPLNSIHFLLLGIYTDLYTSVYSRLFTSITHLLKKFKISEIIKNQILGNFDVGPTGASLMKGLCGGAMWTSKCDMGQPRGVSV